ncbi:MAG: hypothetical protein Q7U39_10830 [Nitrospira sp.]|nr:hypothetical protein [Nitrospira sp.]
MTHSLPTRALCLSVITAAFLFVPLLTQALAQQKADKVFSAVVTDAQGIDTDVRNILFYWEEKVSETAFVPHELRHVPVKRGTATVNVKFDTIKQIEIKPGANNSLASLTISLANGKSAEFGLAIDGKFKGESDFGEVELPATGLKKIVFK